MQIRVRIANNGGGLPVCSARRRVSAEIGNPQPTTHIGPMTAISRPTRLGLLPRYALCALLCVGAPVLADITAPPVAAPSVAQMRAWVEQMKTAPRGPFERIRWFCDDGSILPPTPGACREHDGGVQHGEWNTRTLAIRNAGYLVATLLADIKTLDFVGPDPHLDDLRQILLEQFLIQNDDGWVFRSARFYRGALQVEDERAGARALLLALVDDADWRTPERFLLLREAARLLPVSAEPPAAAQVRNSPSTFRMSIRLPDSARQDPRPAGCQRSATGARLCRHTGAPELAELYQHLASTLDTLYAPRTSILQIEQLICESGSTVLKTTLREAITQLQAAPDYATRMRIAAEVRLIGAIVVTSTQFSPSNRVRLLQASIALEQEVYAVGNQLLEHTDDTNRPRVCNGCAVWA